MDINKKRHFAYLLLALVYFYTLPLLAQEKIGHLVFSELYLDTEQPGNNWVEVYNPTEKPLVFEGFRISPVRGFNMLPEEVKNKGGLVIQPNEYIVLCGDLTRFTAVFGEAFTPIVVKDLDFLLEGGFILITSFEGKQTIHGIRYGNPAASERVAKTLGSQVVKFSENDQSYSLQVTDQLSQATIFGMVETTPTPGHANRFD